MLNSLSRFDPITAAGILARAALALDDESNPAAKSVLQGEPAIRERLFHEIRKFLGVSDGDRSDQAKARIADALDEASDELLVSDDNAVLRALAERGDLPSDLYQVSIYKSLAEVLGRHLANEEKIIKETVRAPEKEQHFGAAEGPDSEDGEMLSLFVRTFPNKYPAKGFTLLVAGQRYGTLLQVVQAWRLYPDLIDLADAKDPLGMMRRFAEAYGVPINVNGEIGVFLYSETPETKDGFSWNIKTVDKGGRASKVMLCQFGAKKPGADVVHAISMGIDLVKYTKAMNAKGWSIA
jgi:hypothetical protein